jgi:hypothetical protein
LIRMRKISLIPELLRVSAPANFFLGAATLALLTFSSCQKDTAGGITVQPNSDLLHVKVSDTTTMVTWVKKEDSLNTSQALSQYVFGSYWDPIFGKTNSSIYTQFTFPTNDINLDFASGGNELLLSCDSIVLSLGYMSTYYGDTTAAQTVKVYQMNSLMNVSSIYKSDTSLPYYPVPVGMKTFHPTPTTQAWIFGKPRGTQLRIPLDRSIGQLILDQSAKPSLANNSTFLQLIKGFYIHSEGPLNSPGDGCMLYLPLTDTLTKLTIYYKNGNVPVGPGDTLSFSFGIDANAARFEHFDHDYHTSDPLIQSELVKASGTVHACEQTIFVSSLSGLKAKIEFPYASNWVKNGPIAVNWAEMTIKAIPSTPGSNLNYPAIGRLALVNIDSLGHEAIMIDNLEGSDYFNGYWDPVNSLYTFHIDRYFQQLLTGKQKNNGLYLVSTGSAANANRVVLGGANNTSGYKMKLRLSYTKLH